MVRSQTINRFTLAVVLFSVLNIGAEGLTQVRPSGYVPSVSQSNPSGAPMQSALTRAPAHYLNSPSGEMGPPAPPAMEAESSPLSLLPPAPLAHTASLPRVEEIAPSHASAVPSQSSSPMPNAVSSEYSYVGVDTSGIDAAPCGCGASGQGDCGGACGNCGYHWIDTFSLNAGVYGFKNGINRGESGSFGFQEGFNWGSPWIFTPVGMNTQIGFRGTQTDFHGAPFTTSHRGQYFFTAGFYKKNTHGWQGGIVFDYLHDDWYTTVDVAQLRGEFSLAAPTGNSLGFAFAQSITDDETVSVLNGQSVTETWETHDYYTLFWEMQSQQCRYGKLRILGGATGEADAIFGTQFEIPLHDNFSLESEFTYLVPNEGAAQGGTQNESWNVGFQLVWYPARSLGRVNRAMSPMFDVAGNGSMITRRQ